MAFLPADQRRCLDMKIQGYSYQETAAQTGLSIDMVKSHLQNGRRRLWLKIKGIGQPR
jgi:DNA-directed RNA polymerase specialized sigma24 family protein